MKDINWQFNVVSNVLAFLLNITMLINNFKMRISWIKESVGKRRNDNYN